MRDFANAITTKHGKRRIALLFSAVTLMVLLVAPLAAQAKYETETDVSTTYFDRQIAMSGSRVAWLGTSNPSGGALQVYLYDMNTNVQTMVSRAVSEYTGSPDVKKVDIDGNRIVYIDYCSLASGPLHYVVHCYDIGTGLTYTVLFGYPNVEPQEVRIFGDVIYAMGTDASAVQHWYSRNIVTGESHSWDNPPAAIFQFLNSSDTRTASSWDYQGWAGWKGPVMGGSYGAWITKKSQFLNESIHTTPSVGPGTYHTPLALELSAQDAAATFYQLTDGPVTPYTGPIVMSEPGTTTVSYWSQTSSGSVEPTHSMNLSLLNGPSPHATPRAWISSRTLAGIPAADSDSGWIAGSSESWPYEEFQISFDTTGSAIVPAYFSVDGGAWQVRYPMTLGSTLGYYTQVKTEGRHRIDYYASDLFGREATQTGYFNFDRYAPTVTPSMSPSGWTTGSSVSVSMTATDAASGVAHSYWRKSGPVSIAATEYAGPITVTEEGAAVEMWSVDRVGKESAHVSVTPLIDRTPPSTTIQYLSEGQWTADPVFQLNGADAGSGVNHGWYRVNGGPIQTLQPGYWGNASTGADGPAVIEYGSVDNLGNTEAGKTITVNIDTAGPQIETDIPDEWPVDENGNYVPTLCTINATDLGAGVQSVRYSVYPTGDNTNPGVYDAEYVGPFWVVGMANVSITAIDNMGKSTNVYLPTIQGGANHSTSFYGSDRCHGPGCHDVSIAAVHTTTARPMPCMLCHTPPQPPDFVKKTIGDTNLPPNMRKSCQACHGVLQFDGNGMPTGFIAPPVPDHSWDQAHFGGDFDSRCGNCHGSLGLASVHSARGVECQKCHNSAVSGGLLPGASRAVAFSQRRCSDCHESVHGLKASGSRPVSVAFDPAFTWTQPTAASVYEAESWFPATAVGKQAQIALSNRAQVTPTAEWTYLSQQMTAGGWTLTSVAPAEGAVSYIATFSSGRNRAAAVVWSGASHTASTASGLGTRVELVWWSEAE